MDENNMAANTEVVATPQDTTTGVNTETTQATEQTSATEVQGTDVTQTKAFASRLKEATEKARNEALDEFIANQGYEYNGKPIKTYSEYQQAMAEVKAEEERARLQEQTGIDPNALKPIFEEWKKSDPDFQELSKARQKQYMDSTLTEFNSEMKDLGLEIELKSLDAEELNKLPNVDKITELVRNGYSLTNAYFLANKKDILGKKAQSVQQETINKITANGQSSPGSLAGGGEVETFFTKEQVQKMTKEEVAKNYNQICKSTAKW